MLLATALFSYYRMCSTDVYCSKQTSSTVAPKETITHHFFVPELGGKLYPDAAKICDSAKCYFKTETQQTFVNGLLGFIRFRHLYSAGSACVLTIITWCPSIWAAPPIYCH